MELTLHADRTVKTVAPELGLPTWGLYQWRNLYTPQPRMETPAVQTLKQAAQQII